MLPVLQQRPAEGFHSLSSLKQSGLRQDQLTALASSDALQALSGHRFASRWQLLDRLDELPLFRQPVRQPAQKASSGGPLLLQQLGLDLHTEPETPGCPLPTPDAWQQLGEDYQSLGLSLTQHPVALLRQHPTLAKQSLQRACDLATCRNGQVLRVIGLVTVRQSPGTAGGVTFVTLEDETGQINLIVWQATALAQQQTFISSRLWLVHGVLQREGLVSHLVVGRIESLDPLLPVFQSPSRISTDPPARDQGRI